MSKTFEYLFKIKASGENVFEKIVRGATGISEGMDKATSAAGRFTEKLFKMNQAAQALEGVGRALDTIAQPAMKFEDSMAELKAITGVTGEAFTDIENRAKNLATTFGGSPAAAAEAFTQVLSRLGPEIAESPKALDAMGTSIMTLSKTMKGDVHGATDALTTAMLQYNVSLKDPVEASKAMSTAMNIMAAGAKVGSAEVTQVAASIKVAGQSAYTSNVSFSEANAAIQVLGKGAFYGAEAGTALRNVMNKLNEGRFLPPETQASLLDAGVNLNALSDKTVPFAVRLSELKKIQGDTALMTKLFGTENSAAANVLVSNTDLITDWQKQLVGTNTATEQAAIQMDTMSEKLSRMSAYWSNVGIEVFGYMKNILPALTFTTQAATLFSQLAPALSLVSSGFSTVSSAVFSVSKAMLASGISALKTAATYTIAALEGIGSWIAGLVAATAAQWELNIAMDANPIGLVILGLAAVAGAVYAIVANWDTVKQWMSDLGQWISDHNPFTYLYDGFMSVYQSLVGKFQALVEDVQWLWDGIKSIFQTPTDRLMAMAQADALKQHMAEKAGDGIWSNVGQRPAATAAPTAGVWESIGQTMGIKPEDKSLLQRIMSGDSGIQIKPEDKAWYEKFVNGQSRYNGSNATILAIQSGLLSKGGPKDLNGTGGGGAGTGQNAIDSTNQAIVNGGRKENNFYITLHDLVGTQNIHVTDGTHPKEVADATLEQLARVLTAVQRGN